MGLYQAARFFFCRTRVSGGGPHVFPCGDTWHIPFEDASSPWLDVYAVTNMQNVSTAPTIVTGIDGQGLRFTASFSPIRSSANRNFSSGLPDGWTLWFWFKVISQGTGICQLFNHNVGIVTMAGSASGHKTQLSVAGSTGGSGDTESHARADDWVTDQWHLGALVWEPSAPLFHWYLDTSTDAVTIADLNNTTAVFSDCQIFSSGWSVVFDELHFATCAYQPDDIQALYDLYA